MTLRGGLAALALMGLASGCGGSGGTDAMRRACGEVNSMLVASMENDAEAYNAHLAAGADYADQAARLTPEWNLALELKETLSSPDPFARDFAAGDICAEAFPG